MEKIVHKGPKYCKSKAVNFTPAKNIVPEGIHECIRLWSHKKDFTKCITPINKGNGIKHFYKRLHKLTLFREFEK